MPKKINIAGMVFGRLTVLHEAEKLQRPKAGTRWACECSCGNRVVTETGGLRSGHVRSCGCLQREDVGARSSKHGMHGTPEYRAWRAMLARCKYKTNAAYPYYGGKGISVCERWNCFDNFFSDMGPRPDGKTLDRFPNNQGNYEHGNCRWAARQEQDANKTSNVFICFDGRRMTCSEWGREIGVPANTIKKRWQKSKTIHPIKRTKESYRAKQHRDA